MPNTLRTDFLLLLVVMFAAAFAAPACHFIPKASPCYAQSSEPTCRYGGKMVCRKDSGGQTICVWRCK